MFDVTDRMSFAKVDDYLQQVESCVDPNDVVMVLVGTKADLTDQRQVSDHEAREKASSLKVDYFETTSLLGTGIDEVFSHLAGKISVLYDQREAQVNFA